MLRSNTVNYYEPKNERKEHSKSKNFTYFNRDN